MLLNVKTSPRLIRVITQTTREITQTTRVITQKIRVITQKIRVITLKIRVISQKIRVITQNIIVITQNILRITQYILGITKTPKIIKNHQTLSNNDKNPKYPYLILGKVYFSRGKSFCAAPGTPRKENTPGIEPGTPGTLGIPSRRPDH